MNKLETFDSRASLGSHSSDILYLCDLVAERIQNDCNDPNDINRFNYIKLYALGLVGKDLNQQLNCLCNILLCKSQGIRMRVPNRIFRWNLEDSRKRNRMPPIPLRHLLLDFSKYCLELQKWKVDYKEIKKIAINTIENYITGRSVYNIQLPIR